MSNLTIKRHPAFSNPKISFFRLLLAV